MARGIALHLGLNRVDPRHYGGWDGQLAACEADAKDMQALGRAQGFQSTLLLTQEATYGKATEAIRSAAGQLAPGDIFLLTYSGHGGQVPDTNSDEADDDLDETWVLYDRQLVDDELYALWGRFKAGVRIVMLSDSCHSGSVAKQMQYRDVLSSELATRDLEEPAVGVAPRVRAMPPEAREATYEQNRALYDAVQRENPSAERAQLGASVLLISGCQDNQLSADGDQNGLFTATLLRVWHNGAYRSGYRRFHRSIARRMPFYQSPNLFITGTHDQRFEAQRPFTI